MDSCKEFVACAKLIRSLVPFCMVGLAACSSTGDPRGDGEAVGTGTLALTAAGPPDFQPATGLCLLVQVTRNSEDGPSVSAAFAAEPDGQNPLPLAVPAGWDTVTAQLFAGTASSNTACDGTLAYTGTQTAFVAPGDTTDLTVAMHPLDGNANVTVTYDSLGTPPDCPGTGATASWADEFSDTTLDGAWTVWQYTGDRHNGLTSPANHISLTDNPGALRYSVDPMTHVAEWHDYQPFFDSPYYWYDPGLSVERALGGEHWALETKADYYLPDVINAAYHEVAVHFDPPGTSGLHCYFDRFSNDDVGAGTSTTNNIFYAGCSIGSSNVGDGWSEWAGLDTHITRLVRFERDAATLKIRESPDGTDWTDIVTVTIPDAFTCVGQKVLISGAAWFNPQGSYADYDYVHFSRAD